MGALGLRSLTMTTAALAALWPAVTLAAPHKPIPAAPHATKDAGASLEGRWTSRSLTQPERNPFFDSLVTTEAKAAQYEKTAPAAFTDAQDAIGSRQSEWWEMGDRLARIDGQIRTSWIVDPADGKLPYSDAGRRIMAAKQASTFTGANGPEDRSGSERCLMGGYAGTGAPMFNAPANANYRIIQTKDHVAIQSEANHEVRIIRLNDPKHPPADVRRWMGDSFGHWEGKTLVVETSNFNPGESFKSPIPLYISADAKVTERFTRISPGEIAYEFTVDDPAIFTRPWRAQLVWQATDRPMFEVACHEGNYSMEGILAGARQTEAAAAKPRAAN